MDGSPDITRLPDQNLAARQHGNVSFQAEFLITADILAGLTAIFLAKILCAWLMRDSIAAPAPGMTRDLILFAVIGALMLREPALSRSRHLPPAALIDIMSWRVGIALAGLLAAAIALRLDGAASGPWPGIWLALFGAWTVLSRLMFLAYLRHKRAYGGVRDAVVVVGAAPLAGRIADHLAVDSHIVAILDPVWQDGPDFLDDEPGNDVFAEVAVLAQAGDIDMVVVAIGPGDRDEEGGGGGGELGALVERLKALPVQIAVCPPPAGLAPPLGSLNGLLGLPMTVVADRPIKYWGRLIKGLMDRVLAAVLLLLLLPLMAVIAVSIAWESPGPVVFRQHRNGWAGRLFTLFKFRTMHHGGAGAAGQTKRNDPRCTRVGVILRRTSLDELPQLWNVLIGDMSLVGPRPHADVLHARERAGCELVAEYARRQRVKPGMTGWAQINGLRGGISTPEQLRNRIDHDLFYIDHWSIWLDIRILLMTPLAVLRAENAF